MDARGLRPTCLLLAAALCGCNAPSEPELEERDVCDEPGPQQILPLSANERVVQVDRLGDADPRLVHIVATLDGPTPYQSEHTTYRAMVTGPCGEDPATLATGVHGAGTHEGELYGCGSGSLLRLDPGGTDPPRAVLENTSCFTWFTDAGLVAVGYRDHAEAWGPLLLLRDGETEPITLVDSIPIPHHAPSPWVGDRQAVVLTLEGQVLEVALADGTTTVLAEPAARMVASTSGRWVLWQEGEPSPDVTVYQVGPIHLLDRETGVDRRLIDGDVHLTSGPFRVDGFLTFDAHPHALGGRVFTLPDAEALTLPDGATFRGTAPDGRVWYSQGEDWRAVEEHLLDLETGDDTVVYEGAGYTHRSTKAMRVFIPADSGGIQRGRLLEVDWDTGDTRLIADGIHLQWSTWSEDRVLAIGDRQDDAYGTLRMYGPDQPNGIVLDDHVAVYSEQLATRRPVGADILYMVLDPDRAGLWRRTLP